MFKLICYLFGHCWTLAYEASESLTGDLYITKCARCGYEETLHLPERAQASTPRRQRIPRRKH